MSSSTILDSVMAQGGRTSRYGDVVVVTMHAGAFATSAMQFQAAQLWARSRRSCGVAQRDRMAFADRFESMLGRSGSGIATRGGKRALHQIISTMIQGGMVMDGWQVPRGWDESDEIVRKIRPFVGPPAPCVP